MNIMSLATLKTVHNWKTSAGISNVPFCEICQMLLKAKEFW